MELNEKDIEKASRKIDLSGFEMQDDLNSRIWGGDKKMKSEVKKTLLKIADDYFESLELPGVDIEDVTMTGSLANYNWSKYSDIDLHIVVDYDDLPMEKDLVKDFFKSKTSNWNKEHDVKIYGYDVELYIQDINEPHHSTGVYSILNNEWKIEPEKKKIDFNDKSVKEKAERLMDRIEEIYDEMDDVDNEETVERVEKLTDKIKKIRQSGLETGGEFSVENIVFKVLRRNGMLDRLYDIKTVAYDRSVTLESNDLDRLIESFDETDFDWAKDIEPTMTPEMLKHGQRFTQHLYGKQGDRVLEYIGDNVKEVSYQPPLTLFKFMVISGWGTFSELTFNSQDLLDMFNDRDLEPILRDDFFLEESNDFDWIEQHEINPWYHYDYLMFDVEPTEEELRKYINMALKTKPISNHFIWSGLELTSVIYSTMKGDYKYLKIDEYNGKYNLYRGYASKPREGEYINLSDLRDEKQISESENPEPNHKLKINKYVQNLTNNFTKFIDGLKTERGEVVDAYKKLLKSLKEGKKLSYEEKKEIGDKLKDVLRLTGFVFATFLPGGIVYLMLAKTTKLKKHLIPKSFWDEDKKLNENGGDDLQWIRDTNPTKITNITGLIQNIFKSQEEEIIRFGGWSCYFIKMSGTVIWVKDGLDYIQFYATPFWNGEPTLPIDYQTEDGDYDSVIVIPLQFFEYEEEFVDWFLKEYPKIVVPIMEEYLEDMGPLPE